MTALAGELVTETFDHDGGRPVTVYVPPDPVTAVVYAADGGWHTASLAAALEGSGTKGTMIVGVHGRQDDDGRLVEYSPAFDPDRFAAHERFFVDEVRTWVRSRFAGADLPPERTAIWGASLGGELSIALAIRHPDVYGAACSASPGAGYRPPETLASPLPRLYLVAGTEEPFFLENATRWADALRAAGAADVVLEARAGDHGDAFWMEEFPRMVAWAFAP